MLKGTCARLIFLSVILVAVIAIGGCSSKPNPELNLGGIDIEEVFNGQILRVNQILGGISDQSSLDKAKDELMVVGTNFDDLIFNSAKLSHDGQTALSILALGEAPKIERLVNEVKASPVLDEKIGGVMEDIYKKILSMI